VGYFDGVRRTPPEKSFYDLFDAPGSPGHLTIVPTGPATVYATAALRDEARTVAECPEGARNHTLNKAWFNMGRHVGAGSIDVELVRFELALAARDCGLSEAEIDRVLRDDPTSGLAAGAADPRYPAPLPDVTVLPDDRRQDEATHLRKILLTSAADIKVRPVHWLWADRVALGTMALLGGRERIGKSTLAYQLAADLTRGVLPGAHFGTPKAAIVAATEDSWAHSIVPRLMAAGADLPLVYWVDVQTAAGFETGVSLPRDLVSLEGAVQEVDAALILLDPLVSRLDAKLDTHKDAEVRQALEPLVRVADHTNTAILGLIHLNKSLSTDPLTMLMGSRAFAAVARAVLFCMVDPDNEASRVLGQPKNNLGRTDLPTLSFQILTHHVTDTDEGPIYTGRIDWTGETPRSLADVIESAAVGADNRTATQEAADWLIDWLTTQGGTDESVNIKREGRKAGHSEDCLMRARRRLNAPATSEGFPRRTYWSLPGTQLIVPVGAQDGRGTVGATSGESAPTALTTPTALTEAQSEQSVQSVQSGEVPARDLDQEADS